MKFRAWHKERKSMHEVTIIDLKEELVLLKMKLHPYSLPSSFDEVVLMQCTGLLDKNGADIYEGDVVKNQRGVLGRVAYLPQEAGYVVVCKKNDYRLGHRNTGESYLVASDHEVIGNILDNPFWEAERDYLAQQGGTERKKREDQE